MKPPFVIRAAAIIGAAVFAASSFRVAPVGLRSPTGLALDSAGTLYVANAGDSTIDIFPPGARGAAAPVRRIRGPATGFISPQGVALDSRGQIYTSNERRRVPHEGPITVYAPGADGNVAPVRTIMGPRTRLAAPTGLALDRGGALYVAHGAGVLIFLANADGDVEPSGSLPAPAHRSPFQQRDVLATTDVVVTEDGSVLVADGRDVMAYVGGQLVRTYRVGEEGAKRPWIGPAKGGGFYVARQDSLRSDPGRTGSFSEHVYFFGRPNIVMRYPPIGRGDTLPVRMSTGHPLDLGAIADLTTGPDGSLYIVGVHEQLGSQAARVAIYSPVATGDTPPVRVIKGPATGLVDPAGIAVDRVGRIYVTNNGTSTDSIIHAPSVTIFAPDAEGNARPIRTITGIDTRLNHPAGLAVADDGTIYVANRGGWGSDQGSITVHAPGAVGDVPPLHRLIGPGSGLVESRGFALGAGDTLYVVVGLTVGSGFDPRYGWRNGPVQLNVYPPGASEGTAPVRSIKGTETGMVEPHAMAIDPEGRIYVTDLREASGTNAYGPDLGAVSVFRARAAGNDPPLRIIAGSQTRLNGPGVPALDTAGNIYVPNRWAAGAGSVTVYGADADGDARPLRIIVGPATGLRAPTAVALDRYDTLYVANIGAITIYAPGANGNMAPVRAIEPP